MAITKDSGRQWPLVAVVDFDYADIPAQATYEAIDLPAGAMVIGGVLEVITPDTGNGTIAVHIGSVVLLAANDYDAAARTFITETDVAAPTSQRYGQWDATTGLNIGTGNAALTAGDVITWETLVRMREHAKNQYMRGLRVQNGMDELYHVFMTPTCLANLKMDNDYMLNLRHSNASGANNKLFEGGSINVDGFAIHEFRHVPHSATWGSGAVPGSQIQMCGAQALAFADIGAPYWVEKEFDYDNQPGISVGKMMGFLKPQFATQYASNTLQDHGVFICYVSNK